MGNNEKEQDLELLEVDEEEGSILDLLHLIFVGMPINFLASGAIAMWGWNYIVGKVFVVGSMTFAQGVLVVLALQLIRTLSEDLFIQERIIRALAIATYTAVFLMVYGMLMGTI